MANLKNINIFQNLGSGTTAVCALHRQKEKTLYIAWVGDSQALLVSQGQFRQCVLPHKPCRKVYYKIFVQYLFLLINNTIVG